MAQPAGETLGVASALSQPGPQRAAKRMVRLVLKDTARKAAQCASSAAPAAELVVEHASERGAHVMVEKVMEEAFVGFKLDEATLAAYAAGHPRLSVLNGCIHWGHLLLPLLGAFFVARMGRHDWKRCRQEGSALLGISAALNFLDVALHVALALGRLSELASFILHGLERLSFFLAVLAAFVAVGGEAVIAKKYKKIE